MKQLLLLGMLLCQIAANAQPSDAYLYYGMSMEKLPALTVAVVKSGHLVYNRNLGKVNVPNNTLNTREHIFLMSSVSNMMIATAVMQLREKGLLKLEDNVNKYLPFSLVHPSHPNDTITIKMLLTHTASIKDDWTTLLPLYVDGDSPIPFDTFIYRYYHPSGAYYSAANNFYPDTPGKHWDYCNSSINLAAYIVQRITGDKFSHYCDTAIFQKLCMKNTSYFLSGIQDTNLIARPYSWDGSKYVDNGLYGIPDYPAGQLRSNIIAMSRFMTMYMQHGIYEGVRILQDTTVTSMMMPQTPSLWTQTSSLVYQGIGLYSRIIGGDTLWGQEGRIYGTVVALYFNDRTETGLIAYGNSEGTVNPAQLFDTLYKYGLTVTPTAKDTFPGCNEITSIENTNLSDDIVIYPNPAVHHIYVRTPAAGTIHITNMQGRIAGKFMLQKGVNNIDLAAISTGLYIAHVYSEEGSLLTTRKIVLLD